MSEIDPGKEAGSHRQNASGDRASMPGRMLSLLEGIEPAGERMNIISAALLDTPYRNFPLVGSAAYPEKMICSLDGFDCVTYMESALALSRSSRANEYPDRLRELRYRKGVVQWEKRNHYMVDWIRRNSESGAVRPVTSGEVCRKIHRTLSEVTDLPSKVVSFTFLPRRDVNDFRPRIESGDLVFFVSTQDSLDVFHTGILVWGGTGLVLRHACRSRGRVIEEELTAFLAKNRSAGIIVARPRRPKEGLP